MSQTLYTICKSFSYSNQYRVFFRFSDIQTLMIEIISPIALLCAFLNIAFFWRIPNSRQPPFDVLLFLSIFSVINITVYISTVIYNASFPITYELPIVTPDTFSDFCLATGTLRVCSQVGVLTYNIIFCLYYTFKIKNPLKAWVKQHNQIHFLCLLLTAIVTIILYFTNDIGVSAFGVCGLKVNKPYFFVQLTINFIYFAILVLTSVIFLKYLKKIQKFDSKAHIFFKYYLMYTFIIAINYLLQSIGVIIITIDCYIGISSKLLKQLTLMVNILVLILPITVTIIIWFHPQARKSVYYSIYKALKKQKVDSDRQSFYDDMLTSLPNNQDMKQSGIKDPFNIQLKQLNKKDSGFLNDLKESNRASLLATILGCISLQARQLKQYGRLLNRTSMGSSQDEHIFSWNMRDRYEIEINEALIRSQPDVYLQRIAPVYLKFISYSASIFQYLMMEDGIDFLDESTNPHRNIKSIYKNAQGDGGRSGQFFYFTSNNRVILKTLTKQQLSVLLERVQNYYTHFKINSDSLIVKIYGLYTAINPETQQQLHLMLMGNLCDQIPKKYVKRIYDLKGSTHQRQVFKKQQLDIIKQSDQILSKKTMKDVDFDSLEKKVWVDEEISEKIKHVLGNDSKFFRDNGLIDYSLIVIKVDYKAYSDNEQCSELSFEPRKMFKSKKQEGYIYIFGIIDYLETWNMKKKSEKWYKSIWTKSANISSQSPHYYSERFLNNLVLKIFP